MFYVVDELRSFVEVVDVGVLGTLWWYSVDEYRLFSLGLCCSVSLFCTCFCDFVFVANG